MTIASPDVQGFIDTFPKLSARRRDRSSSGGMGVLFALLSCPSSAAAVFWSSANGTWSRANGMGA